MTHRLRPLILAALLVIGYSSVVAASEDDRFAPSIDAAVENVILPAYRDLQRAADLHHDAVWKLCGDPTEANLTSAQQAFADTVRAFSRIEFIRFGPIREDNRFERLFYWPDRRGRGLRQVETVIREQDPTAVEVGTLREKSVAVQGLIAMDYVLSGDGADALLTAGSYRCRYAFAIADAIDRTTREVLTGWEGNNGFAATMREAGPENAIFRNHTEVMQTVLKSVSEMLQIDGDMKLGPSVGDTPGEAKPKVAPFWRSNLTLPSIQENLVGVDSLIESLALPDLLTPQTQPDVDQFNFELRQIRRTLGDLVQRQMPFVALAEDEDGHRLLSYLRIPLKSVAEVASERFPAGLGLSMGFNSLDGD